MCVFVCVSGAASEVPVCKQLTCAAVESEGEQTGPDPRVPQA